MMADTEQEKKPNMWDKVEDEFLNTQQKLRLNTYGIKVFKILSYAPKARERENDYQKATKDYKRELFKTPDHPEQYLIRPMVIITHFWNRKVLPANVKTEMSERVWNRMVRSSVGIRNLGGTVPDLIIYWKLSKAKVWFAFLTEEQYHQNLDLLLEYANSKANTDDQKELFSMVVERFPWEGWQARTPYKDFKRWYGLK